MFQSTTTYITSDMKISEVILQNSYLMLLLEHFDIEVPVHDKTVAEVCADHDLNPELFLTFANLYNSVNHVHNEVFTSRDLTRIVAYLKNSHQYYLDEMYPNILTIIDEMGIVNDYPEMRLVKKFFHEYFNEVTEHLMYENQVVFPYILNLIDSVNVDNQINYSVDEYKDHHNDIEEKLTDLKNLIIKYLPQKNDRILRRRLLFSLFELEFDLNIHSKIEDKILIPLVSKMERNVNKFK